MGPFSAPICRPLVHPTAHVWLPSSLITAATTDHSSQPFPPLGTPPGLNPEAAPSHARMVAV